MVERVPDACDSFLFFAPLPRFPGSLPRCCKQVTSHTSTYYCCTWNCCITTKLRLVKTCASVPRYNGRVAIVVAPLHRVSWSPPRCCEWHRIPGTAVFIRGTTQLRLCSDLILHANQSQDNRRVAKVKSTGTNPLDPPVNDSSVPVICEDPVSRAP